MRVRPGDSGAAPANCQGGIANSAHLGGLVIGAIYNGLYLLGLEIQWQLIITGLVLLAAVSVDSLSRK